MFMSLCILLCLCISDEVKKLNNVDSRAAPRRLKQLEILFHEHPRQMTGATVVAILQNTGVVKVLVSKKLFNRHVMLMLQNITACHWQTFKDLALIFLEWRGA
jgi:hypothetical protein